MGFFKSMHDLSKQTKEMQRNQPPAGARIRPVFVPTPGLVAL